MTLPEEDALYFWARRRASYSVLAPLGDVIAASQAHVNAYFQSAGGSQLTAKKFPYPEMRILLKQNKGCMRVTNYALSAVKATLTTVSGDCCIGVFFCSSFVLCSQVLTFLFM